VAVTGEFEERVRALEAELHELASADADLERDAEVAERTRIERSSVALGDRFRGAAARVELVTLGGGRAHGAVAEVGEGWVLLSDPAASGAEHLVRLVSVVTARGLGRPSVPSSSPIPLRSLVSVVRSWCRDRAQVRIALVDGATLVGRADAAYADHLDVVDSAGELVSVPYVSLAVATR
jgi:hypothetical protein